MSSWTKDERFLVEDNGLLDVLYCSKLPVQRVAINSKVGQRHRPLGMSLRAKGKCFLIEGNGLVQVAQLLTQTERVFKDMDRSGTATVGSSSLAACGKWAFRQLPSQESLEAYLVEQR